MSDIISRIRNTGISLGGPSYALPARIDFLRLNRHVQGEDLLLVAVYGSSLLGNSASPCDEFATFSMIRRSSSVETIEYFAVAKALLGR